MNAARLSRRQLLALSLLGCASCRANNSTDPPDGPRFIDVAADAGLDYRWAIPGPRPLNILQSIGNGCAFLDFDNDGNLDILLVGPTLALFHNDGKGHFQNVTRQTGLDKLHGHFLGCAVGDYDNDGYMDIYITAYRGGVLLHNEGGSHLKDVTAQSGIEPQPWGTSAAWVQTTNSGYLDLYICNYINFGPHTQPQLCTARGIPTVCMPMNYRPLPGKLYQNEDGRRFRDVTTQRGAAGRGRGLGIACADFDNTGIQSLAIANDQMPGDLLYPQEKTAVPTYVNISLTAGTALAPSGTLHAGMGTDWGDYDNDGRLDLVVVTFQNEVKSLYHNEGHAVFSDAGQTSGMSRSLLPYVSFGAKFFDFDNDGWLDLIVANGHIGDNAHMIDPTTTYRQPTILLHNQGGMFVSFEDVSKTAGKALTRPIVGRGLAVGDYDNDGRVDVLIVDSEGTPLLLHNETAPVGHWVQCKLVGTRSNRDGYGALLRAKIGERTLLRHCHADGSYMSSSDPRVHFGLNKETKISKLTIRWPSGTESSYNDLPADALLCIHEGDKEVRTQ
jgi:hypothetical protein